MKKLLFLLMIPVMCFGQQKDIYKNALPLINKYFPNNELVQNKLQGFYVKFESCRDTNTVDWLISKQTELCALLTSSIELGFDPDTDQTRRRAYETYQLLNKALPCFSFFEGRGDFPTVIHEHFSPIVDAAKRNRFLVDDHGLEIILDAWGTTKFYHSNYAADVCCGCPFQSDLGSGLHSKLLIAIDGFSTGSDLFSESLEEIRMDVKENALYNTRYLRSKQAILKEFELIKPLLKLTEKEALSYEKTKAYIEQATDEELQAVGG